MLKIDSTPCSTNLSSSKIIWLTHYFPEYQTQDYKFFWEKIKVKVNF